MMLGRKLAKLGVPIEERNIWEEPEAAEFVRGVTGGSETVPTVAVGDHAMVNPSIGEVVAAIHQHAPHLLAG